MNKRDTIIAVAALLTVTGGLVARSAYQHAQSAQEARLSALSLAEFQKQLPQSKDDPAFLYHFGKLLNTQERFRDAQTLLERAAERQPDGAQIRDEWAKALIGQGNVTGGFNVLTQFVKAYPDSTLGHLSLARFYISQNAMDRALSELKQALDRDASLGEAYFLQAIAYDYNSDQAAALKAARQAVALRPESPADHALLGQLLQSTNDLPGARKALERAVALDSQKASYQASLGSLLLSQQELTGAEKAARQATQSAPETPESWLLLGKVLLAQSRSQEATAPLEKAALLAPYAPAPAELLRKTYRTLGNAAQTQRWEAAYLSRRREADALQKAEEQVRRTPEAPEPHQQMARLLARRGEVTGMLRHLGAALHSPVDAATVLIAGGRRLVEERQAALALPVLRDALKKAERSPIALETMGDALLALERPREASIYYQSVAGFEPTKLAVFKARIQQVYQARALRGGAAERAYQEARTLQEGRVGPELTLDSIVELYRKAVSLAPEVTDYRRALVRAYVERRENEKAVAAGRELLALSPEDTLNRALLGIALLETSKDEKDFAEIFAHFNAAWPDPVARPMVHFGRGLLALRRKHAEEAVAELKKATELDPTSEPVWYQLAQALRLKGDEEGARTALSEFTRIQQSKQQEVDLLKAIADHPDQPDLYEKATAFYQQRGALAQAKAIQAEQQRRFGHSVSASKGKKQ